MSCFTENMDSIASARAVIFLVLVIVNCLPFQYQVQGYTREVSGCSGFSNCSRMTLTCPDTERVFLLSGRYGFKPANTSCPDFLDGCEDLSCCVPEEDDCFERLADVHFELVYSRNYYCWNSQSCNTSAMTSLDGCGEGHTERSQYSTITYTCLAGSAILDFNSTSSLTAPAFALRYEPQHPYPVEPFSTRIWQCLVQSQDGYSRLADVTWVRGQGSHGRDESCLSVRVSNLEFLPCKYGVSYNDSSVATPFSVFLRVSVSDPVPDAWAVVLAVDGSNLTVSCSEMGDNSTLPPVTEKTTVTTDVIPTSSGMATNVTSVVTQRVSSTSGGAPMTSSNAPISSASAKTGLNPPPPALADYEIVEVAGWVVAAVIALVCLVLALVVRRLARLRGSQSPQAMELQESTHM